MPTQFEIDCALMAGAAYQTTRPNINRFPIPQGWSEVPLSHVALPSGFEAVAFTNGTEIVISYAGTSQLVDWIANLELGLGFNADQLNQAALYYLQIKAANLPDTTVSFTGHSLGGGLAALMGMFFDKKAVTFDQAPFASSASLSVRDGLVTYLHSQGYSDIQLAALTPELLAFDVPNGRATNITGMYVQGEVLQFIPLLSTLGTQSMLAQNSAGFAEPIALHSQTLLSAFLLDGNFRQATYKLPDLLGMVFDSTLFAHPTDDPDNKNFLDHLVRHEAGNAPGVATADAMLTRFTTDLWQIAQDGGLSLTNTQVADTLNQWGQTRLIYQKKGGATLICLNRMDAGLSKGSLPFISALPA